jgi:hypothetical protein
MRKAEAWRRSLPGDGNSGFRPGAVGTLGFLYPMWSERQGLPPHLTNQDVALVTLWMTGGPHSAVKIQFKINPKIRFPCKTNS